MEVHPAGSSFTGQGVLPGYVRRDHDQALAEAVCDVMEGRSRMVVLVGSSSTGKTRACWEAVQPLADQGWTLWHPYDPTRAEAALNELVRVQPLTVVWLNEAQHYLGDARLGAQIAAAVHGLITDPLRGPVLVLGTLWPEYVEEYTELSTPGSWDRHSRVRELLAGRTLTVPERFDTKALKEAAALAEDGDCLLADVMGRQGSDGRVTQDLAGAPELLRRYQHATPPARALLEAAMDARRLGVGLHLPQTFLTEAAIDYLSDDDLDQLGEDWAEAAFADLARPVHGKQAPLRRAAPRPERRPPSAPTPVAASATPAGPLFRLADYLEQHGRVARRSMCPSASFWHAAHAHLTHPEDLNRLARAAFHRYRLQWAFHLRGRAADAGSADALYVLARKCDEAGEREDCEVLLRRAAEGGNSDALRDLIKMREKAGDRDGAEALTQQAAASDKLTGLLCLSDLRMAAGDFEGAEALLRQAADAGHDRVLCDLAELRDVAGDRSGADAFAQQAIAAGQAHQLRLLAWMRQHNAGDFDSAEALYRLAADAGNNDALRDLIQMREEAGDRDGAEALTQQAANEIGSSFLVRLAYVRRMTGDHDGAAALYRQAANAGNSGALCFLAQQRREAGDLDAAEVFYRQAANDEYSDALYHLVRMKEEAGDRDGAEEVARQAAEADDIGVHHTLARIREHGGDHDGAAALYRQAADLGSPAALARLAQMAEERGDPSEAEELYRQIADSGDIEFALLLPGILAQDEPLARLAKPDIAGRWPYGLNPDGSRTPPWSDRIQLADRSPGAPGER
ncbi:hypothetical protein ACFYOY_35745 [Streptomyces sp. NPDC007875]|uniref:hypothetical protein n=1 Tax=Streptomyces sp. NPDC007875 TaxID=3364783 RepID=UPI00367A4E7E